MKINANNYGLSDAIMLIEFGKITNHYNGNTFVKLYIDHHCQFIKNNL